MDFELNFCEKCFQMTNHLNGVCQKCKKRKADECGMSDCLFRNTPKCLKCKDKSEYEWDYTNKI